MIDTSTSSATSGEPFGDSDAARVDLNALKKGLIVFSGLKNEQQIEDMTSIDVNSSIRIIVGKKGAGKTLYLKLIQDSCKKNSDSNIGSIYFTDIDSSPPDTSLIIKITEWFDEYIGKSEEIWRKIWHISILRTVYSHVFYKKEFDKYLKEYEKLGHAKTRQRFSEKYSRILPSNSVPISIYRQLDTLLSRYNSPKDLSNFINFSEWHEFEAELSDIIKHMPPLYFFIDGLDEEYVYAPHHWLKCQFGLFNCIFRLVRGQQYSGRLHVIACLRDFVYSYVLQSEHGARYLSESKIKVLKWNKKMLYHFLDKKIEMLDDRFFFKDPSEGKTIDTFLGFNKIFNRRHSKFENIYEYILRHTMLMPRDIINIGNNFCYKLVHSESRTDTEVLFKEAVSEVAIQIASDNLLLAAILINTRWIYKNAVEENNLDSFVDPVILEETKALLKKLIKSIDKDRFSQEELLEKKQNIKKYGFSETDYPFTALYHCGLLGYVGKDHDGNDKVHFFSDLKSAEMRLPKIWSEYVFHSCLIDSLNIKPIGEPVYV